MINAMNIPLLETSARAAMVMNCVAYKQGNRVGEVTIEDISEVLKQEDTFVWLGLRESDDALLDKIQEEFGLHELAVEDARSAHQQPKLEAYGDTLFLVMRTAHWLGDTVHLGETHIFVGARFLVSIRHGTPLAFSKVRERCEHMPQRLAKGPGFVLYALMDYVVDNYMPVVNRLQQNLENLEADIFQHQYQRETLEDLYTLKRELVMLRSATAPLLDICSELMRFHDHIVPKDVRPYYRDIFDHVKRIDQTIDGMREMLATAMQVHLAIVTVRQNEVVKRLAGWGAILAIPTMVFSLYGMNFKHMPELEYVHSYPVVLGGVFAGCLVLYVRLKRMDWL